jgi:hypothetical protein
MVSSSSDMNTNNLFVALIFLTCLLLVVVVGYILNHHYRRNRKPPVDVESDPPTHQQKRPEILREHKDEDQRLSHVTTVAPSVNLLPEIRTSTNSNRAEDWLQRRDSWVMEVDLGLKEYRMFGAKDREVLKWDWRDGKDDVAEPGSKVKAETEEMGMEKRRVTVI